MARNRWDIDPNAKHLEVIERFGGRGKLRYMKVLDKDRIIGYTIDGGGRGTPSIRPIHEVHLQPAAGADKDVRYVFITHKLGERLSGMTYEEDPDGVVLADIALRAMAYLINRSPRVKKQMAATRARMVATLKRMAKGDTLKQTGKKKPKKGAKK